MKKVKLDLPAESILNHSLYNKGTAFTQEERKELGLQGLLPYHVSTIEEQAKRRYANFISITSDLGRYNFLSSLQNRNEILFYRLVLEHVGEMVPLIYTPTVGAVSTQYSLQFLEHRGLYLSYPLKDQISKIIDQYARSDVDVIVVTDGERILGLGDLGVGGMAISVGKLTLYTLFGGTHPARTLPIVLDVGTNQASLLNDPLYIGWKNQRITGKQYDEFIDVFVQAVKKRFPQVLLQWEDFGKSHAQQLLDRYRSQICSFNDDIQGTASVALAAVLSAVKLSQGRLKDQKIALLGGGSAGMGICQQIVKAMVDEGGITEEEARRRFYVVDIHGLLQKGDEQLSDNQKLFAHDQNELKSWKVKDLSKISLLEVVNNVHPTILIGVSTQANAFTEEIVTSMAKHVKRPVIFPLSNPTSHSEAHPADLIKWTKGEAIIATGSPFDPVAYEGKLYHIAQCNNVYIFPGVGLGIISTKASYVSDQVFLEASKVLSTHSPMLKDPYGPLFPTLDCLRDVSKEIALKVAKQVIKEKKQRIPSTINIEARVDEVMWYPEYPIYTK